MINRNYLAIDGTNLSKFGVWVDGHKSLNAPEPDVETITIPGRNGSLLIDNGRYTNVSVQYDCLIKENYLLNIMALKDFLMSNRGYRRMEDTFYNTIYREGRYVGGTEFTASQMFKQGYFTLEFDCKPQKYLKTGELPLTYTTGATIYNPTMFNAKPMLAITGYGNVVIGDYTINISQHQRNLVYVDCEMQNATYGSTNMNSVLTLTSGDFPELVPGSQPVTFSGTIESVVITPRWWTL